MARFYLLFFVGNGCSERSCFKHVPPNFPQNLRRRCSRQSSEEGSPWQVPLFFAWANCPQSTLGQSVSVLGVRRPKRGRAWDEGPFPIVSYESYWLKKNYSKWRPSGPGCCIYNFEVQRCLLLWKYIVVTIILLVVLMASHLIYSNAFGKSFKVSQYLHSNATCHQMFA